jgi:hypothetical protein
MNPRFKPLISTPEKGAAKERPFQVKIVPAATASAPFKPLSSVLSTLKGSPSGDVVEREPENQADPKLETKKQGDAVTRITVTCNCGRVHEIDCEY